MYTFEYDSTGNPRNAKFLGGDYGQRQPGDYDILDRALINVDGDDLAASPDYGTLWIFRSVDQRSQVE